MSMVTAAPKRAPSARPARGRPPVKDRRHLRAVPEPKRARPPRRTRPSIGTLCASAVVVFFVLAFGIAVLHTVLVQGQGRLDRLQADVAESQATHQRLRVRLAELESPSRVVDQATQLGMVSPEDVQFLTPVAPGSATPPDTPPAPPTELAGGGPEPTP